MKKIIIGLSLLMSTSATASLEDSLQNICTIVQANDVTELRKKERSVRNDYNLQIRDYFDGIICTGEDMVLFAYRSGSSDVLEYLLKRLPKKYLEENVNKYPEEVRDLIKERIGG